MQIDPNMTSKNQICDVMSELSAISTTDPHVGLEYMQIQQAVYSY